MTRKNLKQFIKSVILEVVMDEAFDPSKVIVGAILKNGAIIAKSNINTHERLFSLFDKSMYELDYQWRYNKKTQTVYWWDHVPDNKKEDVVWYLKKKFGVTVVKHAYISADDSWSNWDSAHGKIEYDVQGNPINEANYSGNVDSYGHVNGVKFYDPKNQSHNLHGQGTGDRWRYIQSANTVVWTTEPSQDTIDILDNFLGKKKIFPKRHILPSEYTENCIKEAADGKIVVGVIYDDGRAWSSSTIAGHHEIPDWGHVKFSWRYRKDNNTVYWWPKGEGGNSEEDLSQDEIDTVNHDLRVKYGAKNVQHKPIGSVDSPERKANFKLSHGVDLDENMIKQLVTEGVREKAMEDFLKGIIKGTEWQGKVYIAGGYVRDEFMGKDPKDLDIMVDAPNGGFRFAKWITKKVGAYKGPEIDPPIPPKPDYEVDDKGKPATPADQAIEDEWLGKLTAIQKLYTNPVIFPRFGTVKFNLRGVVHNGVDLSEMDIEAVMPRKEKYVPGSRKPIVTGGTLKDDVERRDFTVNSLLKDLSTGEILDLTGSGKEDIKAGIVKTPLSPDKIFTDDPLRMLRAIRFTMKYDWQLPMFMIRGLKKNASQLQNISQERIRDELDKMLMTGSPDRAIKLLKVTGLLQYVIPEMKSAVGMTQNIHHKHDVFTHTLQVLKGTQPVLIQRLAALLHDIGKTVTRSVTPTGVHFYGHEDEGEKIADEVMRRLKYPIEMINAVKLIVRNHMRLKSAGDTDIKISDKALRKFKFELGDELENALNVIHADNIAHADASAMPNQINNVRKRLDSLKAVAAKPKLPISGFDLIKMGFKQGPIFKDILTAVTDAWFENPNITKEEAMKIVDQYKDKV